MALADPSAPEGIVLAVRKNCIHVKSVEGEKTRIPADGNNRNIVARLRLCVNIGKMLGNSCVRVKAVDNAEILGNHRSCFRQVGRTAAAVDNNVNLILKFRYLIETVNACTISLYLNALGISASENGCKLHIVGILNRRFNSPAEIAVTGNANSNHIYYPFSRNNYSVTMLFIS